MGLEVKEQYRRTIEITDAARPYLEVQKGGLSHLIGNPVGWDTAYCEAIEADFAGMYPYLPRACERILDIGGGMGGIDIMLSRNWQPAPEITIVDGMSDPPEMRLHRETFSNARVAHAFHTANDVKRACFLAPPMLARGDGQFDLIISLGAWCFHIEPKVYLEAVERACRPGTVLILDVRADKAAWRLELKRAFQYVAVMFTRRKFDRLVFYAR